jgi:hypothetical protein
MKQKTLEEVAEERYGNMPFGIGLERRTLFIAGGKWKEENIPIQMLDVDNIYAHVENGVVIIEKKDKSKISYSEEEVVELLTQRSKHFSTNVQPFNQLLLKQDLEWFEQKKKK